MRHQQPPPRPMLIAALVAIAIGMMAFTARVGPRRSHSPQQEHEHEHECEPERPIRALNNILLVHDESTDGSSWAPVTSMLSARGMHVVAVPIALRSFDDDVDITRRAIAAEDGPVLLVGHSYGGAVITQAGDDPKVAGLMYIAAFAPDVGESPQPDTTITSAAWKIKPCWYLRAAHDRALSPDLQQRLATRMNAITLTLPTSHIPMESRAYDVAAFIRSAAGQPD